MQYAQAVMNLPPMCTSAPQGFSAPQVPPPCLTIGVKLAQTPGRRFDQRTLPYQRPPSLPMLPLIFELCALNNPITVRDLLRRPTGLVRNDLAAVTQWGSGDDLV